MEDIKVKIVKSKVWWTPKSILQTIVATSFNKVQMAQLKDLVKTFDAGVKAFASVEDKIRQNLLGLVRRSVTGGILEVSGRIVEETIEGAKR